MHTISPASAIAAVFASVRQHLNEHQRRLLLGAFALVVGPGGTTLTAVAAGVARHTVRLGQQELSGQRPSPPRGRARLGGGERKRLQDTDSGLITDLDRLVEPITRGEPTSPLRWTCKSTEELAGALRKRAALRFPRAVRRPVKVACRLRSLSVFRIQGG